MSDQLTRFITSFLKGPNGEHSSMRLVLWFYSLLVGIVWAACSLKTMTLAPLPKEVSELLIYLAGAKVAQSTLAESGAVKSIVDAVRVGAGK